MILRLLFWGLRKYCLASLEDLYMENNCIFLFWMERLKAYVDAVFFPEYLESFIAIICAVLIRPSFNH
jgi:hypothetical protein